MDRDPLLAFSSERDGMAEETAPPPDPATGRGLAWMALFSLVVAGVAGGGFIVTRLYLHAARPAVHGSLTIESVPTKAEVFVDGQSRGQTPMTILLPAGSHHIEFRAYREAPTSTVAGGVDRAPLRPRVTADPRPAFSDGRAALR